MKAFLVLPFSIHGWLLSEAILSNFPYLHEIEADFLKRTSFGEIDFVKLGELIKEAEKNGHRMVLESIMAEIMCFEEHFLESFSPPEGLVIQAPQLRKFGAKLLNPANLESWRKLEVFITNTTRFEDKQRLAEIFSSLPSLQSDFNTIYRSVDPFTSSKPLSRTERVRRTANEVAPQKCCDNFLFKESLSSPDEQLKFYKSNYYNNRPVYTTTDGVEALWWFEGKSGGQWVHGLLDDLRIGEKSVGWELSEETTLCPDQTYLWENRIECLDVCGTEFIEASSTYGFMMITNNQAHELSCPWEIDSSCKIIELQLISVVDRYNCAWDFWQVDGEKFCIDENLPLWISGKDVVLHLEASPMPNVFSVRWKCRGHFLEGEKCDFLWIDFLKRFSVISKEAEAVKHGDVFKLGTLSYSILSILKSKTEEEFDEIQESVSEFLDDLELKSLKEILSDNHLLARAGSFARSNFQENIPELVHLMTAPLILLQFNVTSLFLEEEISNEEIITSWIKLMESMTCSTFQYCPELKDIFESLFVDDFMAKNFAQFANVEKSKEAVFYLVGTLSIFAVIPAFVVTQKVRKSKLFANKNSIPEELDRFLKELNDPSEEQTLRELFVPVKQLKLDSSNCELIGEGYYGRIIKTKLNDQEVCVKEVTGKSDAEVQRSILEQAHFLSKLEHENVMGLSNLSWSSDGMPLIIMPLMSRGSLLSFIQHEITEAPLTTTLIIRFARDLCRGMEYLSGKHIIHRDLAARNCLLDSNLNIKISDFGLSRISKSAVEESEVEYIIKSHDLALPLRWVAPEALKNGRFSVMSDVWSFGVLFWEMLSRGIRPYTELRNEAIVAFLDKGERLQRPSYWQDDEVWKILLRTWHINPDGRPTFLGLYEFFKHQNQKYIRLEAETGFLATIVPPKREIIFLMNASDRKPARRSSFNQKYRRSANFYLTAGASFPIVDHDSKPSNSSMKKHGSSSF